MPRFSEKPSFWKHPKIKIKSGLKAIWVITNYVGAQPPPLVKPVIYFFVLVRELHKGETLRFFQILSTSGVFLSEPCQNPFSDRFLRLSACFIWVFFQKSAFVRCQRGGFNKTGFCQKYCFFYLLVY